MENLCQLYSLDILCLTETWESENSKVGIKGYITQSRPRGGDNHGGVACLYRQSNQFVLQRKSNLEMDGLEAICVEIKTEKKEEYLIIVAYIPPNKVEQMTLLSKLVKKASKSYQNVIVTGDLNAKSTTWGNIEVNRVGEVLEEVIEEENLIIMNDMLPTYRNSSSVIDLFIVKAHLNRKIKYCQTLTHENVRSDHISVIMDLDDGLDKEEEVAREKYSIKKTDWQAWREVSEEKFREWNGIRHESKSMDEMVESFMEVFHECMEESVPKVTVKEGSRRKLAPWTNEEVKNSKHELNVAKKKFRRRQTPNNLQSLREIEEQCEKVCEKAKSEWTGNICDKINDCNDPKEIWQNFRALTSYQDEDAGGVLPLMDIDNNPVFNKSEKCKILQNVFFGGEHLKEEEFDETWKKVVEDRVHEIAEQRVINGTDETQYLNRDIAIEETEAALQNLQKGKAPGSDLIYTDLLIAAEDELRKAIHSLFHRSWKEGVCPSEWKVASVTFLKKSGKADYHQPSAYRPISLTSCLGKCMEKIIVTRLYGFVEHHNILDEEQEGFRRFRGTTQALLRLTQDIMNGFNARESTLAALVDMEKAYDSVWRDGLLHKLDKKGIQGRIWNWLNNFLQDRTGYCKLKHQEGEKFVSRVGLPQGSVLSPLLFNIFIEDMYEAVTCRKVKFADDGTLWRSGKDIPKMVQDMEIDLEEIRMWVKKWRMKLNIQKTEFCIFSKDQEILDMDIEMRMADKNLKRTRTPKLLGVILDERLTYQEHVKSVEMNAQKVLSALRILGKTERIDPANMVRLYKSIVVPQLEYAAAIWQSGKCEILDRVQRRGLALCLGVPATASLEALQVEAGVLPLDLRREELAVREFGKICAKRDNQPIKKTLKDWEESQEDATERYISPFGKMADMCAHADISCRCIEPEPDYVDSLQPTLKRPDYWNNLGSSKNRTKTQEEESRRLIEEQIDGSESDTVFIFTDGSCRENPGPCGAGACVYLPGQEECVELKKPVSKLASILLGELVAIEIALNFIQCEAKKKRLTNVKIFSDSQSAVGLLTLGWTPSSYQGTINQIKQLIDSLKQKGLEINIAWTPGHADIAGNEIADKLAKEAAKEAESIDENEDRMVTAQDIKTAVKKSCLKKWQRRWDLSNSGRELYTYRKHVGVKQCKFIQQKFPRITSKLRTGYCLNEYLCKIGVVDKPYCKCAAVETVDHYIMECEEFQDLREGLRVKLWQQTGLDIWSVEVFLTVTIKDEYYQDRIIINDILEEFLERSGRLTKTA